MGDKKTSEISSFESAQTFFSQEIRASIQKRNADVEEPSIVYLVNLLTRYMDTSALYEKSAQGKLEEPFLAGIYSQYVGGTPEVRRQALQRLGDVCMVVTGFFGDSLNRKLVDLDYYFDMGGAAYWQLSKFTIAGTNPTYQELATKFKLFSDVLNEISDRGGMQNNTDVLRLYEKWLLTKNDRLKRLLAEKGIAIPSDVGAVKKSH